MKTNRQKWGDKMREAAADLNLAADLLDKDTDDSSRQAAELVSKVAMAFTNLTIGSMVDGAMREAEKQGLLDEPAAPVH